MNKAILPLLGAVLGFICASSSHASPVISITPDAQNIGIGSPVSFSLSISGLDANTALGAYDINIGFDSSVLSYSQTVFGDPILGDQLNFSRFSIPTAIPGTNTVDVFEFSFDDPATLLALQAKSFTLATLSFTGFGSGTTALSLAINNLTDANANLVPYSVLNSSVTVNAVPVPSALWLFMTGGLALLRKQRRS